MPWGDVVLQHDQTVGVGKRHRLEQHRVDDREDRRVGANAERQRRDRGGREAPALPEHPQRLAQVFEEAFNHDVLNYLSSPVANDHEPAYPSFPMGRVVEGSVSITQCSRGPTPARSRAATARRARAAGAAQCSRAHPRCSRAATARRARAAGAAQCSHAHPVAARRLRAALGLHATLTIARL